MNLKTRMIIHLAWRNVLLNWRHSLATLLAISSGFTAVCLFEGFIRDLENQNIEVFSEKAMLGHHSKERSGAETSRRSLELFFE